MSLHRRFLALTIVPLSLVTGVFACGGKVAPDDASDAAVTPGGTGTSTGSGGSTGSTGTTTPTGGPTTEPTPTPTPTGSGTSPVTSAITIPADGCLSRPNGCPGDTGFASAIVDRWLGRIVDDCASPKTGIPPAPPACATMHVTFSRPGGCGKEVSFSAPEPKAFAACVATAFANQHCVAGDFVDGWARDFNLCATR